MTQLPGQLLNAALSNQTAIRSEIPSKQKRLNLIIAAQQLHINKESFCKFLKTYIEVDEAFIEANQHLFSFNELCEREKALLEAKLILVIFENF